MEISNLADVEFKTLIITILKELSEDLSSIKKDLVRNEGFTTWNKEQFKGSKSRVVKPRIKSMIWNRRNWKITNQNKKKKKNTKKKNEDSVRSLWDNFKHSNIHIIGVPEGEEKEEEIGNVFERVMKENYPNLVKEIDMQSRKLRKSQTRWMQRGPLQDTS